MPKKKHSNRYIATLSNVSSDSLEAESALSRAVECATAKFDESIELHISTNADPRHADQRIRESFSLPHTLGTIVRVLVFAEGDAARVARDAGADYVADEEMWERIRSGWLDWDVSIATPDQMPKLGSLGRALGPRGLMPNARNGTVVSADQLSEAIQASKQGRTEIRMDDLGNLHSVVGRKSFPMPHLLENLNAIYGTVTRAKPEGIKGPLIKTVSVCSTMGPSFRISPTSLVDEGESD